MMPKMSNDPYGVRLLDVDREQRRIRLCVFIVRYNLAYQRHEPLPSSDDLGFFWSLLWEHCDSYIEAQLNPAARPFNEGVISAPAAADHIDKVALVQTFNHPVTDEAWDDLYDIHAQRGNAWASERYLVRGDYDLWVYDGAWFDWLTLGASWVTSARRAQVA